MLRFCYKIILFFFKKLYNVIYNDGTLLYVTVYETTIIHENSIPMMNNEKSRIKC